jgi:hypothetical protein
VTLIAFFLIYNYLTQLEAPLWMIQYTFYALMTAIFGFMFLGILAPLVRERLETAKMKKLEDKESLEALRSVYSNCAFSIELNIKVTVEKNMPSNFTASLYKSPEIGDLTICEELEKQVQEFNRRLELYTVLRTASVRSIVSVIGMKIGQRFPKSLNNHVQIKNWLTQDDFLMSRYLNGEKVTESLFKDSKPQELKQIVKCIDESERDSLDVFFLELNSEFENDEVLQRFRKEKEGLLKCSKETMANLKKEADSINEQLKKYSDLRTSEPEKKSQWIQVG